MRITAHKYPCDRCAKVTILTVDEALCSDCLYGARHLDGDGVVFPARNPTYPSRGDKRHPTKPLTTHDGKRTP